MEMSLSKCDFCGSPDVVKSGVALSKNWDRQTFHCNSCGKYDSVRIEKQPQRVEWKPGSVQPEAKLPFPWAQYNEAQTREKLLFPDILEDLCSRLPDTETGKVGRPRIRPFYGSHLLPVQLFEQQSEPMPH